MTTEQITLIALGAACWLAWRGLCWLDRQFRAVDRDMWARRAKPRRFML